MHTHGRARTSANARATHAAMSVLRARTCDTRVTDVCYTFHRRVPDISHRLIVAGKRMRAHTQHVKGRLRTRCTPLGARPRTCMILVQCIRHGHAGCRRGNRLVRDACMPRQGQRVLQQSPAQKRHSRRTNRGTGGNA
eukprot:6180192-Pleurochrysis_carterae.AAC.2